MQANLDPGGESSVLLQKHAELLGSQNDLIKDITSSFVEALEMNDLLFLNGHMIQALHILISVCLPLTMRSFLHFESYLKGLESKAESLPKSHADYSTSLRAFALQVLEALRKLLDPTEENMCSPPPNHQTCLQDGDDLPLLPLKTVLTLTKPVQGQTNDLGYILQGRYLLLDIEHEGVTISFRPSQSDKQDPTEVLNRKEIYPCKAVCLEYLPAFIAQAKEMRLARLFMLKKFAKKLENFSEKGKNPSMAPKQTQVAI